MRLPSARCFRLALLCLAAAWIGATAHAATKKILLIAGLPSHGEGAHEHNAGVLLLQKCLAGTPGIEVQVALNGWPKSPTAFKDVDAVVFYCDGGAKHLAIQSGNLAALHTALGRGAGLGLLHYAVEPTIENGQREFQQWVGGAFEINWSVNPHWTADFKTLPQHPITRGVTPFKMLDEWYFNMRFVEGMKGVTPILVATPDANDPNVTKRKDGPHAGNPTMRAAVARGDAQTVAWAYERTDGSKGRGFGFTGGHFHKNWGNENMRRIALNAILWLAKADVPANGVQSTLTEQDLAANLDPLNPDTGRKIMPVDAAKK
ncbi:MAG: ThuA domain-containing protein [Verrucomicrobiota bacterium]